MATGNAVKFAYYSGSTTPSSYDSDTIYFLEEPKEIRVGSRLLANVDEDAVSTSTLQSILESYDVKSVEITGSGNVVAGASFNNATGKLTLTLGANEPLAKGVPVAESETLTFGGTFDATTGSAVSGHTITDTKTTFTMPSLTAGDGIEVSGGAISLPKVFYDYLVENTFSMPVINTFTVTGLGSAAEIGTSAVVTGIVHSESFVSNIEGKLTLKNGNNTIRNDINPSSSSASVSLSSSVTVTRNSAGTETFTLSGTTTLGGTISKSVTKQFYVPKFLGSSSNTSVTSTDVLAMQKGQSIPTSITLSSTQYVYFVTDGTITSVKDTNTGFGVPVEAPVTLQVSINGVTVSYHVYRTSSSIMAGTYNFTIA